MEGIEKITDRIAADTASEIEQIQQQARAEADAISARYAAEAERVAAQILARGRRSCEERQAQMLSSAALSAKKARLAVKQALLGEAFSQALDRLCHLPEEDYITLLATLAANASSTGEETLVFSPADRSRYGKKVVAQANALLKAEGRHAKLTLDEQTRPMRGGLCVKSGKIEDNCSLETIVHLMQEEVSGDMAAILFPAQ